MYAGFFGLNQAPFSIAPDPRYLFMSERHREALAHLLYGLDTGGGFVLLTGEIGTGKTTISRCFLQQLPAHCRVAYIFNPKLSAGELLQTICHEFGVPVVASSPSGPSIKDHLDPLNDYLLQSHAVGRHNLLVIDEAQNLSADVLEQLRLLTNLETSERKLLQIVLIGQPELRALLARPELEQLAQRVIARFHLGALNAPETHAYIQHRMRVAGLQGTLPFTESAVRRIHRLTGGVPRRINLLCDRVLLGAYAKDLRRIDSRVVNQAAREVFDHPPRVLFSWVRKRAAPMGMGMAGGVLALVLLLPWLKTPGPPGAVQPLSSPQALAGASSAPLRVGQLPTSDDLLTSEASALRALSSIWQIPLMGDDPCVSAWRVQLQCFRTPRMTLHGLRQLDRPAVLTLHLPGQAPRWVLLSSMDRETATLQAEQGRWRVPHSALAEVWRGDFATLWRQPPGQTGPMRPALADPSNPVGVWIARRLQTLQGADTPTATATELSAAVRSFQLSEGLQADGIAGAMTLMQINRRSAVSEPRLGSDEP